MFRPEDVDFGEDFGDTELIEKEEGVDFVAEEEKELGVGGSGGGRGGSDGASEREVEGMKKVGRVFGVSHHVRFVEDRVCHHRDVGKRKRRCIVVKTSIYVLDKRINKAV